MPSCRSRIGVRDDGFGIELHYAVGIIVDSGFRRNDVTNESTPRISMR